jgi:hypothetical protein
MSSYKPFSGAQMKFLSEDELGTTSGPLRILPGDTVTFGTDITTVYRVTRVVDQTFTNILHRGTITQVRNNFIVHEIGPKIKAKLEKLTAEYNRAKAQRNRRLEKELLLKIKELGG